jgi:enterochelin esterase-like enzyme
MEAEAGQVGRIGCLLVMILVLCAAGIETASGHRHHVSNSNHSHHQQGGTASKSRPLTKTDSSINQQDQGPMMTIKSLASSGEYPPPPHIDHHKKKKKKTYKKKKYPISAKRKSNSV